VVCALDGDISHLKARSQGGVMAREQLEVLAVKQLAVLSSLRLNAEALSRMASTGKQIPHA
jgi:hypothetical protein